MKKARSRFVEMVFVVGFLALAACASASDTLETTAAQISKKPKTFTLHGTIIDWVTHLPIAGASLCIENHPEISCVTTAADGSYSLSGLPRRRTFAMTFQALGYVSTASYLWTDAVDAQDTQWDAGYLTPGDYNFFVAAIGETPDPSRGGLGAGAKIGSIVLTNPAVAGAQFTTDPVDAPFHYFGTNGLPDPTLTATSEIGLSLAQVTAGEYDVYATYPDGLDCHSPEDGDSIHVTVRPGWLTIVNALCQQSNE